MNEVFSLCLLHSRVHRECNNVFCNIFRNGAGTLGIACCFLIHSAWVHNRSTPPIIQVDLLVLKLSAEHIGITYVDREFLEYWDLKRSLWHAPVPFSCGLCVQERK